MVDLWLKLVKNGLSIEKVPTKYRAAVEERLRLETET